MLVYNLPRTEAIFERFGGVAGSARRASRANAQVRAELVLQEEPNRHEPEVVCADISGRSEGGLEHEVRRTNHDAGL